VKINAKNSTRAQFHVVSELDDGKIDVKATYQIANYSQNAIVIGFDAINDDDLILVRDDRVSDNTFILTYIPDNDDEDDMEIIYDPENEFEPCHC